MSTEPWKEWSREALWLKANTAFEAGWRACQQEAAQRIAANADDAEDALVIVEGLEPRENQT